MNKKLTFLLALTFLFLFGGSVFGQEEVKKEYYENGKLKGETHYKNGKKDGFSPYILKKAPYMVTNILTQLNKNSDAKNVLWKPNMVIK